VRVTSLKKLFDTRRTVAFRLTLWYAGIFTISLFAAFLAFYTLVLHGGHDVSRQGLSALREDFREYFGTTLAVVIAASALVGWFMARRALSRLDSVTRTAIAISQGALDRRVPLTGRHDEIDNLAETFNTMVDRIQALIHQMKEVTDNIAHDLRNPITRMRGMAETALCTPSSSDESAATMGSIIEECDRLLNMVNTMLDISEAEAGATPLQTQQADIVRLIHDVCELFRPVADDNGITLNLDSPPAIPIICDVPKIQRVLANLLDNAIKYTPKGGSVTLTAREDQDQAVVTIKDTGIGISDEEIPHIFERFYRGEKSRSQAGNGLGLTLARAFVRAHEGTLTATSSTGGGSTFTMRLPLKALGISQNADRATEQVGS